MSNAEQFVREHTRNCSNEITQYYSDLEKHYHPWLTPDHAREVAKIAREETLDKVRKCLIEWAGDYVARTTGRGVSERKELANDVLEYFRRNKL